MSENNWREDVIQLEWEVEELRTFTGSEIIRLLMLDTHWEEGWLTSGMECRYLSSSGSPPGWRKGKVRVAIEFIPDEPLPPSPPPSSGKVESVDGTFFGSYSP